MSANETAPLHPLHTPEFVAEFVLSQGRLPGLRHTGRSTALALDYVRRAPLNPHQPVVLCDHHDNTTAHTMMKEAVVEIIRKLDFRAFQVVRSPTRAGTWALIFGERV